MGDPMSDPAQAVRVEAARMTAQVLAGHGPDLVRLLTTAAFFETFMMGGSDAATAALKAMYTGMTPAAPQPPANVVPMRPANDQPA